MAGACRTQASVFWGFCRVLRASQRGQGFFGVCCLLRVLGVFKVVGFFGVKFLWRLQAILGGVCAGLWLLQNFGPAGRPLRWDHVQPPQWRPDMAEGSDNPNTEAHAT